MASRRSVWGSFEEYSNATRCPFHRCDRVTLTSIQPIFASTESFPMASQLFQQHAFSMVLEDRTSPKAAWQWQGEPERRADEAGLVPHIGVYVAFPSRRRNCGLHILNQIRGSPPQSKPVNQSQHIEYICDSTMDQ
ncbi:hypothetical protein PCH_Pc14g02040 [Penicillium rubens Wisconsin 54-1255]|uniref:Uncharacterized protein n=1 Tax=Penicillium rubens (strain ATCC 28089 / DSM 1075 / NRRL 1951 / Wisconsin 54-1255) TaxID=500485 RepID=B6H632_PENRW|nr:hypothetical protein PCH_Pc14g02040 [Penicillium rubens Wisconsin 54-1255]